MVTTCVGDKQHSRQLLVTVEALEDEVTEKRVLF